MRHAVDDGGLLYLPMIHTTSSILSVFRQGYLWVKRGIFSPKIRQVEPILNHDLDESPIRKWHRLYTTKLYTVSLAPDQPTCLIDVVCEIGQCLVSVKLGDAPYVFTICTPDGGRFDFQVTSISHRTIPIPIPIQAFLSFIG